MIHELHEGECVPEIAVRRVSARQTLSPIHELHPPFAFTTVPRARS